MNRTLPTLTDEEVRRSSPADEESGFGALNTGRGPLPLQAMDVETRIDGLLARTELRQTFVNTLGEPLEATYIFPLPDRAAVMRFRMEVAGRVVEGILKERAEARHDYDQAVRAGRRAAITEEERPGVFTLRVGNLMPGEQAVIRLTLTGPLTYADGEATYRFPLVVAPRYIPGTPLDGPSVGDGAAPDTDAVPDASRITPPVLLPGFPNPVRLSLAVDLRPAGLAVTDVRSSLHAVVEEGDGDGRRRIALRPGERLNRDFILRFRVGDEAVQTSLALQPDAGGGQEGTFLLTVVPPAGEAHTHKPRDVVFLLDRSASMAGWKMVAARRSLARMVDSLTDGDRFTVYAFDDRIEMPPAFGGTGLVPAGDRNRFRAVEFLAKIEARGGTELARPLDQAVGELAACDPRRDRIVVLVTDGQVGNEDQILRTLGARLREMRVFTLGIDQAVNEGFLKRLASLGGGCCELVESEGRLDEVMDKVHRRIGAPVLTGVRLEAAGLEVDRESLVPARLPDLFAGVPLFILGRYRGAAGGSVTVRAQDAAARPWTQAVTAAVQDSGAVGVVWARGHVRELEDRYATGQAGRAKLEKEIVQTSLRFGVLCRFTAFVAVDVKEVVNPGGQVQRVTQPVEPAAGWAMLGTDAGGTPAYMAPLTRAAMPLRGLAPAAPEESESVDSCLMDFEAATPPIASSVPRSPPARPSGVPPAKGPGKSLRQKLGGIFGRRATPSGPATPPAGQPTDLTAYRRRALELLQQMQSAADRLTGLGVLAVRLAALVEDLRSTGVAETTVRPLDELLQGLRGLMAQATPGAAEVDRLWSEAGTVLQGFGQGAATGGAPAARKREGFWK
jgi:Ca-activated chloride channel family protein